MAILAGIRIAIPAAALLFIASACSQSPADSSGAPSGPGTERSAASLQGHPLGVVAIGHSGLTGGGTDPSQPAVDVRENTWATGTNPEVNSVYQRLVAVHPPTEGHVANTAQGGATAAMLAEQARAALEDVPRPELVVIQTIDNDIRCDGTDDAHVAEFGASVAQALEVIVQTSPETGILVVSQPGRPASFAAAVASHAEARANLTGSGMCDLFDSSGALNEEGVAALTAIIERYEAEQARVCAAVPQCSDDDGALTHFVDDIDDLVPGDWGHLTTRGHARLAELIWPTIAKILEY